MRFFQDFMPFGVTHKSIPLFFSLFETLPGKYIRQSVVWTYYVLPETNGANTYSLRTTRKKTVGQAMKVAGIWTEESSGHEKRSFGYDLKSFFFIGRKAISVNVDNQGKRIFQFNYRWPKLRTFPPDNYCIDEAVQIAEGLYLGQLTYATELFEKYDPAKDSCEYKYRVFGYFLLMDEEWHRRRLKIGFDLDNT